MFFGPCQRSELSFSPMLPEIAKSLSLVLCACDCTFLTLKGTRLLEARLKKGKAFDGTKRKGKITTLDCFAGGEGGRSPIETVAIFSNAPEYVDSEVQGNILRLQRTSQAKAVCLAGGDSSQS